MQSFFKIFFASMSKTERIIWLREEEASELFALKSENHIQCTAFKTINSAGL